MICSVQALHLIPCYSDRRQQVQPHSSAALATIVHMPMWCTVSGEVKCSDRLGIFIYLFIYLTQWHTVCSLRMQGLPDPGTSAVLMAEGATWAMNLPQVSD